MELTSGVLITFAVVVVVSLVLGRVLRRREPVVPAPAPAPVTPSRSNPFGSRQDRESQSLVDWLLSRAFEQTGVRVADDPLARQRIVQAAQTALTELRTQDSATISLPFLTATADGPKHFEVRVTRNTLKELAT